MACWLLQQSSGGMKRTTSTIAEAVLAEAVLFMPPQDVPSEYACDTQSLESYSQPDILA